jgi:hypothetical protein
MTDVRAEIASAIEAAGPVDAEAGPAKKNYTERLSDKITKVVAGAFAQSGLTGVRAPEGRDKQFMGGYGTKGVDAYLSDEKHGLLMSSGTKGILFAVAKNLRNRYRDMAMEALELHKRFPFAVCGHLLFLSTAETALPNKAFGTVLGEAVALLFTISGRGRPDEAPEVYEEMGILLLKPVIGRRSTLRLLACRQTCRPPLTWNGCWRGSSGAIRSISVHDAEAGKLGRAAPAVMSASGSRSRAITFRLLAIVTARQCGAPVTDAHDQARSVSPPIQRAAFRGFPAAPALLRIEALPAAHRRSCRAETRCAPAPSGTRGGSRRALLLADSP